LTEAGKSDIYFLRLLTASKNGFFVKEVAIEKTGIDFNLFFLGKGKFSKEELI